MELDINFYRKIYIDVRNLSNDELLNHYKKYGLFEGRVCNKKMLDYRVKKNNEIAKISNQNLDGYTSKNNRNLINIIIRTSKRPKCFDKNIRSIVSQNYDLIKVYISYDNEFTKKYIDEILKKSNLCYEKIQVFKSDVEYFYNGYPNEILKKVNDGYVIFLDDDDMFLHNNALHYINDYLKEDIFLSWNYLRSDKIIGISNGNIKSGKVTSCGFCYHSSHSSKWELKSDGDYYFVKNLIDKNNLKFGKISKILTGNINKNIIYGEGKCEDI